MACQHVKDFHGKVSTASAPVMDFSMEKTAMQSNSELTAIGNEASKMVAKPADFGKICTNVEADASLKQASEQIYIYGNTDTESDQSGSDSYKDICPNANLYGKVQYKDKDDRRACSIEEKIEENIEEMIKASSECGKSLDRNISDNTRTSDQEKMNTSLVCKEINPVCVGSNANTLGLDSSTKGVKCEVDTSDSISANANLYVKESFAKEEVLGGEGKFEENLTCGKDDVAEWNMESKIDNLEKMIKHIHYYIKDCFLEESADKLKTSVDEKSDVRDESLCEQVTESNVICKDNQRSTENDLLQEDTKCNSKDEEYDVSDEFVSSETTVVCEETVIKTDPCAGINTPAQEEEQIINCDENAELLDENPLLSDQNKELNISERKTTEVTIDHKEIEIECNKTFARQTSQQAFYKYKACKELMDKFYSSEEYEEEEEIVKEVLNTLLKRTEMRVNNEVADDRTEIDEPMIDEPMMVAKVEEIQKVTPFNERQPVISERKTDYKPEISIDPIKEPEWKPEISIDPIKEPDTIPEISIDPIKEPDYKPEISIDPIKEPENKEVIMIDPIKEIEEFKEEDRIFVDPIKEVEEFKEEERIFVDPITELEEFKEEEQIVNTNTLDKDVNRVQSFCKNDSCWICKELFGNYCKDESTNSSKDYSTESKEETASSIDTCKEDMQIDVKTDVKIDYPAECKEETYLTTETLVCKEEVDVASESVLDFTPGDLSLEVKDTDKIEIEDNSDCIESEAVIEKETKEEKVSERVSFEDFSCPICQERFSLCDKKEEISTKELELKEEGILKIEDPDECVGTSEATDKIEKAESYIQSWASRDSLNEDYGKSNEASGDSINEEICETTEQITEKESEIYMSQNNNIDTNDFSVNIEEVKATTDLDAGIKKAIDDVLDMRKFFCKPSCPICKEIFKDKTADEKEVSVDDVSIGTTEVDGDSMNITKAETDSIDISKVDDVSILSTGKLCTPLEKVDEVNESEICNDMLKEEIREIKEQLDENKAKIDCLREIVSKANEVEMKYEAETETKVECESETKIESENTVVGSYEDLSCSICKDRFSDVNQSDENEDQGDVTCPPIDGCGSERIVPSAPIDEGQNGSECLNTDSNENAADSEEPKKETKKKWRIRFVRSTITKDKNEEKESKTQEEEEKKTEKEKSNKIRFVIEPAESSDDETKKNSTKVMVGDDESKTTDKKTKEELELKNVKHAKIYKEKNAKVEIVPKKSKDFEEAVKAPIRPNSVTLTFDDSIWKVRYVPIGAESEEERQWRMQFEPHCLPDTDKGLKMHFVPVNADEKNPLRMRFVANEDLNLEEGWEIHFAPPELPDDDSSWVIRFSAKGFMDDFILVIYGRKMDLQAIWKDIPFGERCAIAKAQTGVTPTWGAVYRCK